MMEDHSRAYLRYTFEQYLKKVCYPKAQAVTPEQQLAVVRGLLAQRQQLPAFIGNMLNVPPIKPQGAKPPESPAPHRVPDSAKAWNSVVALYGLNAALLPIAMAITMASAYGVFWAILLAITVAIPSLWVTGLLWDMLHTNQDFRAMTKNFVLIMLLNQVNQFVMATLLLALWMAT